MGLDQAQKAATDAKRGKLFTKLARAITVAAREVGETPQATTLAAAVEKAKGCSMPKATSAGDRRNRERAAGKIERVVYGGTGRRRRRPCWSTP